MKYIRLAILILTTMVSTLPTRAEDIEFKAQAPRQVIVGKAFQVYYQVNQHVESMRAPEFVDFELLAGPYFSQGSNTIYVNGQRTASRTTTFTYTLRARRPGTYTIGPAQLSLNGKTHNSNGVRIEVLPEDETPAQNSDGASNARPQEKERGQMFVRTIVSKSRVMEQEALTLTYKLYFAAVDVAQLTQNNKYPDFTGFLKQEIDLGEHQVEMEHYEGRNYRTYTLYQTLLYPQHSGDIHIDPASFELIIQVPMRGHVRSIVDDMLGMYQNVSKILQAPAVTIHVDALPAAKPADYSGAVGRFSLNSELSKNEVDVNEAITLKMTIQGSGNMKLIKTPTIHWPEGFEAYDPKVNNAFRTSASGMSGTKTIEYLAIPRTAGEYTIPAVSFSYYDTEAKAYRTVSTQPQTVQVRRGAAATTQAENAQTGYTNYVNQEEIKQLGTDIRYIHTGAARPAAAQQIRMGTVAIVLLYLLPTLLAILVLIVMHKRVQQLNNAEYMRLRRAKRSARQHLQAAKRAEGDIHFWTEIEHACRACEAYVDVSAVLQTAEYARYAPTAAEKQEDIYRQTQQLIDQLEAIKL